MLHARQLQRASKKRLFRVSPSVDHGALFLQVLTRAVLPHKHRVSGSSGTMVLLDGLTLCHAGRPPRGPLFGLVYYVDQRLPLVGSRYVRSGMATDVVEDTTTTRSSSENKVERFFQPNTHRGCLILDTSRLNKVHTTNKVNMSPNLIDSHETDDMFIFMMTFYSVKIIQ